MSQPPDDRAPEGQSPEGQSPEGRSPAGWGPPQYGAPYPPQPGPHQPGPYPPGPYQPGPYQPGPYQPGQHPSPYTPLEGARSDKTMRWVGLVVGFFVGPTALLTLWTVVSFFFDAVGLHGEVLGVGSVAVVVVFGAAMVAGLVFPQTRWWALGMIIGIAVTFIVLAGACLAFIYLLTTALEP